MPLKLGRKPARHTLRTMRSALRMQKFLDPLGTAPATSTDYLSPVRAQYGDHGWGMMLNDSLGDCHDAQTEVLTEHGWQAWPNYDGSLLATMNQKSGRMEFQVPLHIVRKEYDGPMHFSEHKSLDFALTPQHRMFCRPYIIPYPYKAGVAGYVEKPQFIPISALPNRVALPGTTTGFLGTELKKLQIGQRTWSGDDLLALLALVISDGFASGGETNRDRVSFCCFDERYDSIAAFAYSIGATEFPSRKGVWVLRDDGLAEWLRSKIYVGPALRSPFKCVPDLVKVASERQINRFLSFFGDCSKSEPRAFYSTSKKLIDDLQELLLRIGKRSGIHNDGRKPGHELNGKWIESTTDHFTLTEWERDIVTLQRGGPRLNHTNFVEHYKGEVFCATVPNSTLVTRRNGQVLISGNCVIADTGHEVMIRSANTGTIVIPSDADIEALYGIIGGYVPGDESTDNGCDETTMCEWLAKHDWYTKKPAASTAMVDFTNVDHVKWSVELFGSLRLGLNLPQSAMDQFNAKEPWNVATTDTQIIGGHDVPIVAYDGTYYTVITWGQEQLMTPAFLAAYCEEAHIELWPDWMMPSGNAPSGVDWNQLASDLASLSA